MGAVIIGGIHKIKWLECFRIGEGNTFSNTYIKSGINWTKLMILGGQVATIWCLGVIAALKESIVDLCKGKIIWGQESWC